MSSTEFTVGLDRNRNSSKVLKPPGGGSSDIFGLGPVENTPNSMKKDSKTKNRLFGDQETRSPLSLGTAGSPLSLGSARSPLSLGTENSPAFKKPVRRNPITGEGFELNDDRNKMKVDRPTVKEDSSLSEKANLPNIETPKVVQTSIRVRNPPGGKSSGIF